MADEKSTKTFNPQDYLMQLKSKEGNKDYLPVQYRVVWFREMCPEGTIETEEINVDLDRECEEEAFVWNNETRRSEKVMKRAKGYARYKAIVTDGKGGRATGHKSETRVSFPDYAEKAETGAIGRALANLGYGTQFTGDEFDERWRLADSPVARPDGEQEVQNAVQQTTSSSQQKPAGTTPVKPATPPASNGNGTQAQTRRSAPTAVATKERMTPEQHAPAVAGAIPVEEVTPVRIIPLTEEDMTVLQDRNKDAYELMDDLRKRYGPSEEVAFRSFLMSPAVDISSFPRLWTEQQVPIVLELMDTWDTSTNETHSHTAWVRRAKALDSLPEQKDIFDALVKQYGAKAVGFFRDGYSDLKGKKIGELSARLADWYILALRNATFHEGTLTAAPDFTTLHQ